MLLAIVRHRIARGDGRVVAAIRDRSEVGRVFVLGEGESGRLPIRNVGRVTRHEVGVGLEQGLGERRPGEGIEGVDRVREVLHVPLGPRAVQDVVRVVHVPDRHAHIATVVIGVETPELGEAKTHCTGRVHVAHHLRQHVLRGRGAGPRVLRVGDLSRERLDAGGIGSVQRLIHLFRDDGIGVGEGEEPIDVVPGVEHLRGASVGPETARLPAGGDVDEGIGRVHPPTRLIRPAPDVVRRRVVALVPDDVSHRARVVDHEHHIGRRRGRKQRRVVLRVRAGRRQQAAQEHGGDRASHGRFHLDLLTPRNRVWVRRIHPCGRWFPPSRAGSDRSYSSRKAPATVSTRWTWPPPP